MENQKIKNLLQFYVMATQLKDTIRRGWQIWNIDRDRIESVAEHIYGVQMLAIAMYSEYQYDIDLFYTAFLHEVGHSKTYFGFSEEEVHEYDETLRLMDDEPNSFAEGINYTYSHLPIEYEATRWAVNYINTYPERIKELVDIVGKAVKLFYQLNDYLHHP